MRLWINEEKLSFSNRIQHFKGISLLKSKPSPKFFSQNKNHPQIELYSVKGPAQFIE